MNYAQKLLTRLKAQHDGCSDYRAAQILEISPASISLVKKGRNGFSDLTINKIAQELGENPMKVIGQYHLETQDFPSMNNVWESMVEWGFKEEMKKYQNVTTDKIGNVSGL